MAQQKGEVKKAVADQIQPRRELEKLAVKQEQGKMIQSFQKSEDFFCKPDIISYAVIINSQVHFEGVQN